MSVDLEKPLFIKAILQGYIFFRDDRNVLHKGFIVGYEENIAYFERHLKVAYGVHYFFNHLVDGSYEHWLDDCDEELIRNPRNHPYQKECYTHGLTLYENDLDFEHYGTKWALTKEELL